ncbi:MAG: alpha/beta hydrolase [Phenylobacterium sp.]|uniref:alpha/beta fold hydrolase n=1 Tax=Phenylobacterium sp. TaxID=1871053 RepID=UPI001A63B00E|nr:alpha/beta hydrolase [Phenylobacterium sp.]MBL8774152.1 alpha/beta hydrolase [Phenylobacterium sp.]
MNAIVDYQPTPRRIALPGRGGEMAVLDFGPRGRPVDVVFSHANGFNGRTYRTILAPLAGDVRMLALDLRGHGASTLPAVTEGRQGWHEFRDDLLALLAAEADGPVVLAGHSMGGTTSLLAAAAEPERVRALALFDPVIFDQARAAQDMVGDNPLASGADRRRAVFPDKAAAIAAYTNKGGFRTWRPEQLADYVEAGFAPTADGQVTLTCAPAWEASNFRIHNYDAWAAFRAVRCPVRILRAEHGSTARINDNLADLAAIGAKVEVVPGTTHFLPMERPDLVRQVLRELVG